MFFIAVDEIVEEDDVEDLLLFFLFTVIKAMSLLKFLPNLGCWPN